MIIVDPLFDTTPYTNARTPACFRNTLSCHLMTTKLGEEGERELVAFARKIGLKPSWLQHKGRPSQHFDLVMRRRVAAVAAGAVEVKPWPGPGHPLRPLVDLPEERENLRIRLRTIPEGPEKDELWQALVEAEIIHGEGG